MHVQFGLPSNRVGILIHKKTDKRNPINKLSNLKLQATYTVRSRAPWETSKLSIVLLCFSHEQKKKEKKRRSMLWNDQSMKVPKIVNPCRYCRELKQW